MSNTIKIAKHYALRWQTWLHGLIGAAIGGGANAICACLVKPEDFNLGKGVKDLATLFAVSAIVSAALYLRSAPVPPMEEEKE